MIMALSPGITRCPKNQTSPDFLANTEPQLMKEPEKIQDLPKKLPGFGTALALAVLLVAFLASRR